MRRRGRVGVCAAAVKKKRERTEFEVGFLCDFEDWRICVYSLSLSLLRKQCVERKGGELCDLNAHIEIQGM